MNHRKLSARPRHNAQAERAVEALKKLPNPLEYDPNHRAA